MGTPSTPEERKSVRVPPELHARLAQMADRAGTTLPQVIAALASPHVVRINLSPEQHARWTAAARANGLDVGTFAMMRTEAAMQYGADPQALRRIHDGVHALVRAAGVIPQHTRGVDEQTITDSPRQVRGTTS